jgi:1-acyl-sn-glycerol-3-phosphate acyltransferase
VTTEQAHRRARDKGVSRVAYTVVRALCTPVFFLWFRLRIAGAEHIPATGAAIVAPNHKSFFDSFFIAMATKRHLRFMGKSELFDGRWGRLLISLGAFPVQRGTSDTEALETAREILRQGGLLAMFPEGTRVRDPRELGSPRKGVGRLALETGAPIVPCAIEGTDRRRLGPFPRPRRVQVSFASPVPAHFAAEPTPEAARALIADAVWPEVEREFKGLVSRPTLIAAGLTVLGVGGAAAARRRRRRK